MAERIDSLMAVIADRVKTHVSHSSTIADDVERIDNQVELIVTNPTTISSKGKTGGKETRKSTAGRGFSSQAAFYYVPCSRHSEAVFAEMLAEAAKDAGCWVRA